MANRRIKSTVNNPYVQPLKLRTGRKLVIAPATNYTSVLFTPKHRAGLDSDIFLKLAVKFNSNTFDGVYLTSMLVEGSEALTAANCVFEVYAIGNDGTWTETLLATVNGTPQSTRFVAAVPAASLTGVDIDGSTTLAIKCTVDRRGTSFSNKIYANHLGIFESLFLLKQEVEFLDLTKLDE